MLAENQLRHFEQRGFVTVEGLIDEATLDAVRNEYSALLDQLYDGWFQQGLVDAPDGLSFWDKLTSCCKNGIEWYQHLDISLPHADISEDTPMHIGPAVFDLLTHSGLLDAVEQLIGPEITSNPIQHTRFKPPMDAVPKNETRPNIVATDWHQDMGVTLEEADNSTMVTVWLAVTDATVANGCLQVSPGVRDSLLPHCSRTQLGLAEMFVSDLKPVPAPVKAGGAVIFNPFTPHASLPNLSDGFRWSFDLRYNASGHPTGRSKFPEFIARSRSQPWTELRDWQRWLHSWQETRTRLASAAPTSKYRWDNDAPYCA